MDAQEEFNRRRAKLPPAEKEVLAYFDRASALLGMMQEGGWQIDANTALPFLGLLVAALERADERLAKAVP